MNYQPSHRLKARFTQSHEWRDATIQSVYPCFVGVVFDDDRPPYAGIHMIGIDGDGFSRLISPPF